MTLFSAPEQARSVPFAAATRLTPVRTHLSFIEADGEIRKKRPPPAVAAGLWGIASDGPFTKKEALSKGTFVALMHSDFWCISR